MPILETRDWVNDITQIETTDVVLGGATGIANQHAKELAARTNYLKDRLGTYGDIETISTASTSTTVSLTTNAFKPFVVLPATNGGEIVFNSSPGLNQQLKIIVSKGPNSSWTNRFCKISFTGKQFLVNGEFASSIYLYIGEYAEFIVTDDYGIIQVGGVDFGKVGKIEHKYASIYGTIKAEGQLLDRNNYPRLWALISSAAISEAAWTSSRKGYFSVGNGSTTFRVPDLRNVVIRGKDASSTEGMYQADNLAIHKHDNIFAGFVLLPPSNDNRSSSFVSVPYINSFGSSNLNPSDMSTENTGTVAETRVKNIAYTAYIHY